MKRILVLITLFLLTWVSHVSALSVVRLGPEYFPEADRSRALSNGYIYVGEPDTNPTVPANQKTLSVQQESGTIVAVPQPIRTNAGGVPVYNGSPVTLLVDGNYSLLVQNSVESQEYYVPSIDGGPVSGNLSDYGCNFSTMVSQIGSDISHVIVDCDPDDLTTNITIPSNITIEWRNGHTLGGAFTLTINGDLIAGRYDLFDPELTVLSGTDKIIFPEWFGVYPDGSDITTDFNRMVEFAKNGGSNEIKFTSGTYFFGSKPDDVGGLLLMGESSSSTIFRCDYNPASNTEPFMSFTSGSGGRIRDIYIGAGPTTLRGVAILVGEQSGGGALDGDFTKIENVVISEIGAAGEWHYGIYLDGSQTTGGIRDTFIANTSVFACTNRNIYGFRAIGLSLDKVRLFGAGGSTSSIELTGDATQSSSNVLGEIQCTDLFLDWADQVSISGDIINITTTANTTDSLIMKALSSGTITNPSDTTVVTDMRELDYELRIRNHYTDTYSIPDDGVEVINLTGSDTAFVGIIEVVDSNNAGGIGQIKIRTGSAPDNIILSSANSIAEQTGVLTGSTGPDNSLNISTHTDGNLYIENRQGAARTITITIHGRGI